MRRMRPTPSKMVLVSKPLRTTAALAITVALVPLTLACSKSERPKGSPEFCEPYLAFDTAMSTTTTTDPLDRAQAQLPLLRKLVKHAPPELKADLTRLLAGYQDVVAGTPLPEDRSEFEAAARRINRYGAQGCGVYERKGPL